MQEGDITEMVHEEENMYSSLVSYNHASTISFVSEVSWTMCFLMFWVTFLINLLHCGA